MLRITEIKYPLLTHLIICGMGFMGVIFALSMYIGAPYFDLQNYSIPYAGWAAGALALNKAALLIAYLTGIASLFCYIVFALFLNHHYCHKLRESTRAVFSSSSFIIFMLTGNTLVLLALWAEVLVRWMVIDAVVWVILLLFPVWSYQLAMNVMTVVKAMMERKNFFFTGILMLAGLIFITALSPFFKLSSMRVSNDYLWMPEKTYIKRGIVDNNRFIMNNGIGGLYHTDLIQSEADLNLKRYHAIPISMSEGLRNYLISNKYQFDYIPALKALFVKKDRLSGEEKEDLCALSSSAECREIIQYNGSIGLSKSKNRNIYDFIQKNRYEIAGQILAGHYFHHQYAMLGPVNEYTLGKNPSSIIYLYGLGNVKLLTFIFDHLWPSLTFENYVFTLYFFYFLYFALLILTTHVVFKDVRYVALTSVAVIGFFLMIGFEMIRVAPGFNPLRHFSDLFVMLSFYAYLNDSKKRIYYLLLTLGFGLLSIYANKEFGLMIFASVFGASLAHIILCSKRYSHLMGLFLGILGFGAMLYYLSNHTTSNPMSIYSVMGVSVAPSRRLTDFALMIAVFFCYASLITLYFKRGAGYPLFYLCLYLFFYTQCLWVYYAWYTEPGHLYSTSPIWVFFLVLLYRELAVDYLSVNVKAATLLFCEGSFITLLLLAGCMRYFSQEFNYWRIFKNHVVYQWDFPNAHFQSTMDPSLFQDAVTLIQAFSPGNAIYLISKYDNFLPFLAGKYSAMPYLELSTSLVTDTEVDIAANTILNAQPKYLFVDTDINTSNVGDILDPRNRLKKDIDNDLLSGGRVKVLSETKRVFKKVASQYHLIKSGQLVSVYERN